MSMDVHPCNFFLNTGIWHTRLTIIQLGIRALCPQNTLSLLNDGGRSPFVIVLFLSIWRGFPLFRTDQWITQYVIIRILISFRWRMSFALWVKPLAPSFLISAGPSSSLNIHKSLCFRNIIFAQIDSLRGWKLHQRTPYTFYDSVHTKYDFSHQIKVVCEIWIDFKY